VLDTSDAALPKVWPLPLAALEAMTAAAAAASVPFAALPLASTEALLCWRLGMLKEPLSLLLLLML
jgi:hypothetical protein